MEVLLSSDEAGVNSQTALDAAEPLVRTGLLPHDKELTRLRPCSAHWVMLEGKLMEALLLLVSKAIDHPLLPILVDNAAEPLNPSLHIGVKYCLVLPHGESELILR